MTDRQAVPHAYVWFMKGFDDSGIWRRSELVGYADNGIWPVGEKRYQWVDRSGRHARVGYLRMIGQPRLHGWHGRLGN